MAATEDLITQRCTLQLDYLVKLRIETRAQDSYLVAPAISKETPKISTPSTNRRIDQET